MTEVLHANIFFLIASFGVVVFIILTSIILYQVVKISVAIRRLAERIEAGSEAMAADMASVREYVTEKGSFVAQLLGFFSRSATQRSRRSSRRSASKNNSNPDE